VADVPFRPVGIFTAQPRSDLLRAPGVLQLAFHQTPQLGVNDQTACALATGVVAGTRVSKIGVIDTFVVRFEVTTKLPRR